MDENVALKSKNSDEQNQKTSSNNSNPITNYSSPFTENDKIILNLNEDISTNTPQSLSSLLTFSKKNNDGELNIPSLSSGPVDNQEDSSIISKIKSKFLSFFSIFSCIPKYLSTLGSKIQVHSSYKYFTIFLIIGLVFMFFSFISLPFVIFKPCQLLSNLSIGNILIMISFLFYYGSTDFFGFLTDKNRGCIMSVHLIAVIVGLFLSFTKLYIAPLLVDMILLITTVMFILTLLPGGQAGNAFIKKLLLSPIMNIFNRNNGNGSG